MPIEKLKTEMQESVAATKKELDQKLAPVAASVESLKSQTKAGFEETRKQIEERVRELAQGTKTQEEALKKVEVLIASTQATLAELSGKTDALVKDSAELRAAVRSFNRSIRDLLKAQETAFQEALRSIRAALNGLGTLDEKIDAKTK